MWIWEVYDKTTNTWLSTWQYVYKTTLNFTLYKSGFCSNDLGKLKESWIQDLYVKASHCEDDFLFFSRDRESGQS